MDSKVEVSVPDIEDIVDAHIRAAVANVLTENHEALVKQLVDQAMNRKQNSYDRKTAFQKGVEDMIRAAAKEIFEEWLTEEKPRIKEMIKSKLKDEGDAIHTKFIDALVGGLGNNMWVNIDLKMLRDKE